MLDFLEGALLGPLWSDTEYEKKRFRGLRALFSLGFWLVMAFVFYKENSSGAPSIFHRGGFFFLLSFLIFLISPLLCYIYYYLPFLLRLPILALQFLKFFGVFLAVCGLVSPYMKVSFAKLFSDGMLFFDHTLGSFIDLYTEMYGEVGMFLSVIGLGILGTVFGLLFLFFLVKLPQLILRFVRYLQSVYDQLLIFLFDLLHYFKDRRSLAADGAFAPKERERS